MSERFHRILSYLLQPVVALGGAVVIAVVLIGMAWRTSTVLPVGQYVAVQTAPITAVGGANSELSFQVPGQIVAIPVKLGQIVGAGATLIALDQSALLATRAGAVANLEAAQARLAALRAGTRPEQLTIDETAVTQAEEALRGAIRSAYITADDAIHTKTDQFFLNPRTSSATLAFTFSDQTLQNTVQNERVALEAVLADWGSEVSATSFATQDPHASAAVAQTNLAQISAFLDTVASLLAESTPSATLPLTTLQGYQSAINTARLGV